MIPRVSGPEKASHSVVAAAIQKPLPAAPERVKPPATAAATATTVITATTPNPTIGNITGQIRTIARSLKR